jgi:hypothetical protein|tara:strand:+ start:84 stop:269 length:186 start_codon:yes stop_codon:yes gene_type:complete
VALKEKKGKVGARFGRVRDALETVQMRVEGEDDDRCLADAASRGAVAREWCGKNMCKRDDD